MLHMKSRLEVGAQGLNSLISVLKTDASDSEIVSYVLDTFCNICSPEEFDEEGNRVPAEPMVVGATLSQSL